MGLSLAVLGRADPFRSSLPAAAAVVTAERVSARTGVAQRLSASYPRQSKLRVGASCFLDELEFASTRGNHEMNAESAAAAIGGLVGLVFGVGIFIVIMLLAREIVCWYWKVNQGLRLLESIDARLARLAPADVAAASPPATPGAPQ